MYRLYTSYYFCMSPPEVMNKLGDQPKELLGVLICRFAEFLLKNRKKKYRMSRSRTKSF